MYKLTMNREILKIPKKKLESNKFWVFLQARYA
ncbi:hypothetical protein MNBD_GAMMA08-2889 [hydrothermal vent metagenome]|uniref:Uncharacterized protein n=1 Tax=hydrothermal vent metagenome TaxID=652676 RepID=A0A3B0XX01_9ZZZZ